MDKERIIQEFVPGKQVTLAHLIAHPGEELAKKIGVPDAGAIGIMTLTPGETAMIAGDLALKAADVHIGFLDRFSGALVIYGSVGAVEEALSQTVSGGNDSNLLIVFYVQIMPDDFVMQLHRF
ncbi:Ethanolamine utilization protein EutS [Escherichia coli]|uniref:ethanolamine utilization microcompartment protein EutS n=1 Tax=Escherichia coli TaxID=562 RepID=UPI00101AF4C2|nr:ethanolamine utilization microcompartment protein EutS [Escherichia coli]QAY45385.1 Ethanolamine utilization protein EutS [Escherichia coli]QAY50085.1 Ethanolamine utilization protein EutS [Escherichia coli]QAZ91805.1 Ethanolamine utilization protein EutS [Escherichia coli]QBC14066.1 Ethanolamine utilization protein EutS [Escherichia coli]